MSKKDKIQENELTNEGVNELENEGVEAAHRLQMLRMLRMMQMMRPRS